MDRDKPLASPILGELGCGVKGVLTGRSGVFRKGHSSRLYKRELTEPMLHARARV